MRMPTLLPFGEGRVSGEAIDTRTKLPFAAVKTTAFWGTAVEKCSL
jgi:hypothetical protein